MDKGSFLLYPGKGSGSLQHVILYDNGRSHAYKYASIICISQDRATSFLIV